MQKHDAPLTCAKKNARSAPCSGDSSDRHDSSRFRNSKFHTWHNATTHHPTIAMSYNHSTYRNPKAAHSYLNSQPKRRKVGDRPPPTQDEGNENDLGSWTELLAWNPNPNPNDMMHATTEFWQRMLEFQIDTGSTGALAKFSLRPQFSKEKSSKAETMEKRRTNKIFMEHGRRLGVTTGDDKKELATALASHGQEMDRDIYLFSRITNAESAEGLRVCHLEEIFVGADMPALTFATTRSQRERQNSEKPNDVCVIRVKKGVKMMAVEADDFAHRVILQNQQRFKLVGRKVVQLGKQRMEIYNGDEDEEMYHNLPARIYMFETCE